MHIIRELEARLFQYLALRHIFEPQYTHIRYFSQVDLAIITPLAIFLERLDTVPRVSHD